MEKSPKIPIAPVFDVDLSEGWDTQSQLDIFFEKLRKMPFYRTGLLYSGFNADDIGTRFYSRKIDRAIFCESEAIMENADHIASENNPFHYAMCHNRPAISVYDPLKLEKVLTKTKSGLQEELEAYRLREPSALIATIRINLKKSAS